MSSRQLRVAAVFICLIGTIGAAQAQQSALRLIPATPCRIADTRNPNGPFGGPAVAAQSSRSFVIPNSGCNIPSTAAAYSLNITVVPKTALGYLSVWPTGQSQPLVSTLNSNDGRVKANAAIVPAGTNGAISVYVSDASDVILDINGYFVSASDNTALAFFPLIPCRIADTRGATAPLGGPRLGAQQARSFPVLSSNCNVPSAAQAYSLNFTAVPPSSVGFLSTWPTGMSQPLVSTLNVPTGQVTANAAIVPAGTSGAISVLGSSDTDVVIDINGYFAPFSSAPNGLSLYTLAPCRVLDTRGTTGMFSGTATEDLKASPCGVVTNAAAVVLNATVVPDTGLSYLSLWPSGQAQPTVSTLNASDGMVTANMAIVPTSSGAIDAYATNPTHMILDTSGYFSSIMVPTVNSELNGRYAFSLQGYDGNGNLVTMAGSFVANGNGVITSGYEDRYETGASAGGAITGSYSVGTDNRGTMTLTTSHGSHTFAFSLGKISSGVASMGHVIESDTVAATGVMKKQDTSAFSSFGSTAASFAFGGRGQNSSGRTAVAGQVSLNGSGGMAGMMDFTNTSSVVAGATIAGSYTVGDTTNGRGTITFTSPATMSFAFYIVSVNEMFVIDSDPTGANDAPTTLYALKQASSFPAPASGSVSVLALDGISHNCAGGASGARVELDLLQWGTPGNATVSGDTDDCGVAGVSTAQSFTATVAANGRMAVAGGTHPPVFYLVNSSEGFMVGTNTAKVESGYLEPQASGPFSNSSLSGTYFFGSNPMANYGGGDVGEGMATLDGQGGVSGISDYNGGGTMMSNQTFSDTLSVSANGRAVNSSGGVSYVISSSKVVMIDGTHSNVPTISIIEK